ncbi:LPS-assembly protein LptD [Sphingomonas montana]|uniref:LPS-assembly protein LptD n=1 Tax=Sphingomonas montana TaxID=1843236 RepID=UPI00096E370A|nr:LPS assembly protein LptD [Sphingomonas montana]
MTTGGAFLSLAILMSGAAAAQPGPSAPPAVAAPDAVPDLLPRAVAPPADVGVTTPLNDDEVGFSSDTLDYDSNGDVVTAAGDVRMVRAGNRVRADRIVWNRRTGAVRAEGNVAVANPGGDTAYGDSVDLTDTLKDGVIENLLLVLEDGGRLAAVRGTRVNGVSTLERAAYTPCAVTDAAGCPRTPVWTISAVRVVHDPVRHRISYRDARFTLLGVTILWLPGFSHPDGQQGGGPGLLVPDFQFSRLNGAEFSVPYYIKMAPGRDLTITPHVYTKVLPAIGGQYRELTSNGAYQVGGMVTYGSRSPALLMPADVDTDRGVRGYIDANGKFQFDPAWSLTESLRLTTDRTFLRRYDITNDDRLRSVANVERIDRSSYLSIAGYAVQTLRAGAIQGQQPIAIPAIDYRRRLDDPLLGGRVELQVNSLSLIRTAGQDTQRAFAGARWDMHRYTALGQEVTLTAYARGDVYHTDDGALTPTVSYRGQDGWTGRGVLAGAVDMRWPFVGTLFGGTQTITPRVQIVATPPLRNSDIPNEDSRAIDLETLNLFAINRFSGYDRFEDGSRAVYGAQWAFDRPRLSVRSVIGQSYRLTKEPTLFPEGTGLTDRFSDIVAQTTVRYGRFAALTQRIRIDKDSLNVRRNEVDATIGGRRTYATVGYFRLNRNVNTAIEDLRDREEVRLGGRIQLTRTMSVFGSTVIDLTGRREDPVSLSDGYQPVRQRIGLLYSDECLEVGATYRRDFDIIGSTRRGSTVAVRLALKNLGR